MQLEVFHQASFKISRSNKPTRMYYLARTVEEVMSTFYLSHFHWLVCTSVQFPHTRLCISTSLHLVSAQGY